MRVRYIGPDGAVNHDVGRALPGQARLVHGHDYDVPPELAERLMASSQHWVKPPAARTAPTPPVKTEADKPADKKEGADVAP